jgi:hypothetical protein
MLLGGKFRDWWIGATHLCLPYCFPRNFFRGVSGNMDVGCDTLVTKGLRYHKYEFNDGIPRSKLESAGALLKSMQDNKVIRFFRWYDPTPVDVMKVDGNATNEFVFDDEEDNYEVSEEAEFGEEGAIGYRYDGLFRICGATYFVPPATEARGTRSQARDKVDGLDKVVDQKDPFARTYLERTVFRFAIYPKN